MISNDLACRLTNIAFGGFTAAICCLQLVDSDGVVVKADTDGVVADGEEAQRPQAREPALFEKGKHSHQLSAKPISLVHLSKLATCFGTNIIAFVNSTWLLCLYTF